VFQGVSPDVLTSIEHLTASIRTQMHLHSAAAALDLGNDLGLGDASAVRLGQYLEETLVTVKPSVNSRIALLN
jgi:hypothetical protein